MPSDRILDVGGTPYNWNLMAYEDPVTLLNIRIPENVHKYPQNFTFVEGDGTDLPYRDEEFDIVFSNSVIEHVGSMADQKRFANEVRRVGKKIWIQTPAKSFFFEPHYLTPFVHWFPKAWQKRTLRYSVRGLSEKWSQEEVNRMVDDTRLLTHQEIKLLFPDCHVRREYFLFLTKSYIVTRALGE